MKAKFQRFTHTKNLDEILFRLPKDIGGFYQLQGVYLNTPRLHKVDGWDFTLNEVKEMTNFKVKNENGTWSKYKTSKGFIDRLKTEI